MHSPIPEQRYRQRYVDLIVNPEVREVFVKANILINSMRYFLNSKTTSKWKPRSCSRFMAVLRHGLLKPFTTPSI